MLPLASSQNIVGRDFLPRGSTSSFLSCLDTGDRELMLRVVLSWNRHASTPCSPAHQSCCDQQARCQW